MRECFDALAVHLSRTITATGCARRISASAALLLVGDCAATLAAVIAACEDVPRHRGDLLRGTIASLCAALAQYGSCQFALKALLLIERCSQSVDAVDAIRDELVTQCDNGALLQCAQTADTRALLHSTLANLLSLAPAFDPARKLARKLAQSGTVVRVHSCSALRAPAGCSACCAARALLLSLLRALTPQDHGTADAWAAGVQRLGCAPTLWEEWKEPSATPESQLTRLALVHVTLDNCTRTVQQELTSSTSLPSCFCIFVTYACASGLLCQHAFSLLQATHIFAYLQREFGDTRADLSAAKEQLVSCLLSYPALASHCRCVPGDMPLAAGWLLTDAHLQGLATEIVTHWLRGLPPYDGRPVEWTNVFVSSPAALEFICRMWRRVVNSGELLCAWAGVLRVCCAAEADHTQLLVERGCMLSELRHLLLRLCASRDPALAPPLGASIAALLRLVLRKLRRVADTEDAAALTALLARELPRMPYCEQFHVEVIELASHRLQISPSAASEPVFGELLRDELTLLAERDGLGVRFREAALDFGAAALRCAPAATTSESAPLLLRATLPLALASTPPTSRLRRSAASALAAAVAVNAEGQQRQCLWAAQNLAVDGDEGVRRAAAECLGVLCGSGCALAAAPWNAYLAAHCCGVLRGGEGEHSHSSVIRVARVWAERWPAEPLYADAAAGLSQVLAELPEE
eukprot:TRINITY_DN4037_c0_g1_i11.p1 TRINITY_DN4037_c0_g1~~TRINITY_DN4037_c0_g1_i11.p1  ORF type:complete len:696 (+),score=142.65 TRINITY_DN4037_c0_g1_i11:713-2800(+)